VKVLVVGGGGREHALAWKIAQSPLVRTIYCIPGNAGIAELAECTPMPDSGLRGLADFAASESIDLTVVGPEAPLVEGICGLFQERGLTIFGPSSEAALIEGSKPFAKQLMKSANIPTAPFRICTDPEAAVAYIRKSHTPTVVKAGGLAAGKGVIVTRSKEEALAAITTIMVDHRFGDAGATVVIEDRLEGEEASVIALTDGENVLPLLPAQDHKPLLDGDRGPNTGGMGAYAPAPLVTPTLVDRVVQEILTPVVREMARLGRPYRGALYAGLIISNDQVSVLEFNCRFGDPETQPVLPLLDDDLVPLLLDAAQGSLKGRTLSWSGRSAVTVIAASRGYPERYQKGLEINGLESLRSQEDILIFHAGTTMADGRIVTSGGRVLGVTGLGGTLPLACDRAYQALSQIDFEGMIYRRDIGAKALKD
jgi:phosphoribosylamine--glycine ligase